MSRIARIIYPGYPHHIVQRGNNKQCVFRDSQDKQFYLSLLKKYSFQCGCKTHAYCLMPNHIHLLLVPTQEISLAKTMQKLSLTYTQYINKKYNRSGRLWESRYYSSLIDKESYLWSVCIYIEQNPLRAGITNDATKYMWSSAKINCGLIQSNFVEPIWKEYLDKNDYQRLLSECLQKTKTKKIRVTLSKSIPLGSEEFLYKMVDKFGEAIIPKPRGNPHRKKS